MPRQVFGPFIFDPRTNELRREGIRIPLQGQPGALLKALAEHPGQLVPREALQKALWGENTFVDFEDGLNAAACRLRQALGDSSHHPVYIETLPKRGYRLLVPVEERASEELPRLPGRAAPRPKATGRRHGDRRRWRPGLLATAILALALAGAAAWASFGRSAGGAPIRSLAVLPLHALSAAEGKGQLASALTEELAQELAKVRDLHVVPTRVVAGSLGHDKTLAILARELGADALVEGSLVQDGSRCRLVVMLVRSREWSQWTGTYEAEVGDVHGLMSRVALDLEAQLR